MIRNTYTVYFYKGTEMVNIFSHRVELQADESKQKWKEALNDPLQYTIEHMKMSQGAIMPNIKKIFGVTPQAIRNQMSERAIYLRPLVLWLLANKTDEKLKNTMQEFGIELQVLDTYKDNDTVKHHYKDEIEQFFQPLVDSFLCNMYANLVVYDVMQKMIDDDNFGYTIATLRKKDTGCRVIWALTKLDSPQMATIKVRTDEIDKGVNMGTNSITMSVSNNPKYIEKYDANGHTLDKNTEQAVIDFIKCNKKILLQFWNDKIDEYELKSLLKIAND